MNLLKLRSKYQITQQEAAKAIGIPLRTYCRYELDEEYGDALKRQMMIDRLTENFEISESRGILSLDQIRNAVAPVLDKENGKINFCYLFGSYAKGTAKEDSDIDLYVDSTLTGFSFVGLTEKLRNALNKRVDVIRPSELSNNIQLTNEIMKWGIKIYG